MYLPIIKYMSTEVVGYFIVKTKIQKKKLQNVRTLIPKY